MIVNIHKATGQIVDKGQHYDERYYDNVELPDAEAAALKRDERVVIEGDKATVVKAARLLKPIFVALDDGTAYTESHSHGGQYVEVLAGEIAIVEAGKEIRLAAGERITIAANVMHQIVGKAAGTAFLTLHL